MSELKSILRGAAPLSAIEFLSMAAALVTLPYLMRVLGPVEFGRFAFGAAAAATLGVFVDYGFNQLGPKEVARTPDDGPARALLLGSVQGAKLLLAFAFVPLLGGLAWLWGLHLEYGGVLPAALWGAASAWLFPQWFLQGTQRYRTLAASLVAARTVVAIATVLLVSSPKDAPLAVAVQSSAGCLAALFALADRSVRRDLRAVRPDWSGSLRHLRLGLPLFVSTVAVSIYTTSVPLLVGMLTTPGTLGIYSAADKIRGAFQALLAPIGVAAFPKFSLLMHEDRSRGLMAARRLLALQVALGAGAAGLLLLLGEPLVLTIIGATFLPAVATAQILGLCMVFTAISNTLGMQLMLPLNMDRAFSVILTVCAGVGVAALSVLCSEWKQDGAALAVVGTEALVALLMAGYLRYRKII